MEIKNQYDVIVIGGGHAGCEAALAASRMGANTLLLTISIDNIGLMSCNPAIGGLGKGNLVKDLDALGGEMPKNIDASGIQFRILNKKKGPAVWSSRAQADKYIYKDRMQDVIMSAHSLSVKQAIAADIITENKTVKGVQTTCGQIFYSTKIIICGGTFIGGMIYIGNSKVPAGRMYEPPSTELSISLKKLGFNPIRLKTDTPARIHIDSINTNNLEVFESDQEMIPFSNETKSIILPQIKCYITYTNERTHTIIRENINKSLFYNGKERFVGPRYCPSIEDKVIKFPDKTSHKIVLEPEGLTTKEVHVNGFSTSLPIDVQLMAYRTLPGLENCIFTRPAYAIQYDTYSSTELYKSYESKKIGGLYFAGQVNGTSGYEEAAVQGFLAGVNAVLSLNHKEPFILGRDESYLGVLTDDLMTKGVDEPYRMFTSRSEYRLLTREDNAEDRLIKYGYNLGLISKTRFDNFLADKEREAQEKERLLNTILKPDDRAAADKLKEVGIDLNKSISAYELLKRPELRYNYLCTITGGGLSGRLAHKFETELKYSGYIDKERRERDIKSDIDNINIPVGFVYDSIPGLRKEYSERLEKIRPSTLGQALRIPGMTLAAIDVLSVEIAKFKRNK